MASDYRKPGGLTVVVPGRRRRSWRRSTCGSWPGVGPKAEARLRPAGVETVGGARGAHDEELRAAAARCVGVGCCASGRGASTRAGSSSTCNGSRSRRRTRSSATSSTASGCTASCAGGAGGGGAPAEARRGRAHGHDEAALRGLLDPQPVDVARPRHRRRRADRRPRVPAARSRRCATGPERSASSASASPGSVRSGS